MIKISMISVGLVILFIFSLSWASEEFDTRAKGNPMPAKTIDVVLKEHTESIMSVPGVVGTAQGLCDNKPCIKVYVTQETPELEQKIPQMLEGYPVMIEQTQEIRPLPKRK